MEQLCKKKSAKLFSIACCLVLKCDCSSIQQLLIERIKTALKFLLCIDLLVINNSCLFCFLHEFVELAHFFFVSILRFLLHIMSYRCLFIGITSNLQDCSASLKVLPLENNQTFKNTPPRRNLSTFFFFNMIRGRVMGPGHIRIPFSIIKSKLNTIWKKIA